jgi:putative flippase GtrA
MIGKGEDARLFIGFVVVGALGFATDAGLLAAGLALGLSPVVARAISVTTALQTTFVLNGLFVFRSLTKASLPRRWVGYMVSNGFGAACNYLIFIALTASRLPLVSERAPAFVAAAAIALVVNFTGTRLLAFRRAGGAP